MRMVLTLTAVVLAVGAAFDLLITLDLAFSHQGPASVGDYLRDGAPLLSWAGDVLARALPAVLLDPVMTLPPDWFFPVRAAAMTVCAAALFALVQARRA